jgi:thioredoxin reductase (NADPH)
MLLEADEPLQDALAELKIDFPNLPSEEAVRAYCFEKTSTTSGPACLPVRADTAAFEPHVGRLRLRGAGLEEHESVAVNAGPPWGGVMRETEIVVTHSAGDDTSRPGVVQPPALLDDDDPALFPKLTDEQLALLRPLGHVATVEVGQVLFRIGDVPHDVMVLLAGSVAVLVGSAEAERELTVHKPRDLMTELSVLTGHRVHANGVVREPGSVLVVPVQEFRALLGRELAFGDFVFQTLFRRRQAVERIRTGIRIVGSRFDRDTHRLREFASRNRVLHTWVDIDEPRRERLVAMLPADVRAGPIVLLGDGNWLQNPTNTELADRIGVAHGTLPTHGIYDLVVVGAGPAGLAATVYGASGGLRTVILDAVAVGGQAATSARIENYLGFPAGISGAELAERAQLQAEKFDAHVMVPRRAVSLSERNGFHVVTLDDGQELLARSVILALGVRYRRLPVPRAADYEGLGVTYAADSAREQLRPDDAVVVVGGANSAGQAALSLAEDGRHAYLVARAGSLERSMARYLRDRMAEDPNVEVLLGYEVREVDGEDHLERVSVVNQQTGERRVLAAGVVVVLIGAEPPTEWLAGEIALDADGYVLTGPSLPAGVHDRDPWNRLGRGPFLVETSRPGVFAVGDVRSGSTKMVAPAVGEGGMAVRFVAEHLARVTRFPPKESTPRGPSQADV